MKTLLHSLAIFLFVPLVITAQTYESTIILRNFEQKTETTLEFDLILKNTGTAPWGLDAIQTKINYNNLIFDGLNASVVQARSVTAVTNSTGLVGWYGGDGVNAPTQAQKITLTGNDGYITFFTNELPASWPEIDVLQPNAEIRLIRVSVLFTTGTGAPANFKNSPFAEVEHNVTFDPSSINHVVNRVHTFDGPYVTVYYKNTDAGDYLPIVAITPTTEFLSRKLAKYCFTGTAYWNSTSNWNNATSASITGYQTIPPSTDNIVLLGGTATINDNRSVQDLTIKSTGTLMLDAGKQLTVSSSLYKENFSASSLLLRSTVDGTASLIHNTSGVTATVECYIPAGTWADGTDGWHLLSSPVAAQAIDPEFTSSGGGEYDFYAWSEPAQVWLNQKVGANNITTFNVGQGYLAAYQNTDTKVFSGALNIADKSVTLTQNAGTYTGWNLLGNPYSSALTWNTGWTLTNIGGVAQIWNEGIKDYSLINAGAAIPAMNGFMVYTSVASQSLTIPAAQRVHSATAWYKSAAQQIELIAHDPQGESAKSSFIGFDSKATAGFDLEYDAYLLSGYAPKFYSVAGGSEFSLNTLPEAVSNLTIPFGFVKNASSSFSIELAQSIEGHSVWLRDLLTNTVVNLSDTPVYSFTSADGDNAARFEIVLDMFTGTSDLKALASAYAYSADNRIVVTGVNGETKMDVISIQGQVLKTFEFFSTGQHDVSVNLSTGVYLVRLYNSGEIRTMKVMVK